MKDRQAPVQPGQNGLSRLVLPLAGRPLPPTVGLKARNLRRLLDGGWRVPASYVCTWEAHERYLAGGPQILDSLAGELQALLRPDRSYAVRSSGDVEDGVGISFAGQFRTLLGVRGTADVIAAVRAVWDAAATAEVREYAGRAGVGDAVKMAVLIQEMVEPRAAGVAFSHDPITGELGAVVESIEGSGEALVQRGATPQRWVRASDRWRERPAAPAMPEPVADHLASTAQAVSCRVGRPVDLEWAWDGREVYWLQLRELAPPRRVPVYSNQLALEMLPGAIAPLQWSVPARLVLGAWLRLFGELLGPVDAGPEDLAGLFSYHAYFNMGTVGDLLERAGMPRDAVENMMGVGRSSGGMRLRLKPSLLPRLLRFGWKMFWLGSGVARWHDSVLAEQLALAPIDDATGEPALQARLEQVKRLASGIAYYAIVVPLNMYFYDRLLRGQLAKAGVDPASLDVAADLPALAEVDPDRQLARLRLIAARLPAPARSRLGECSWRELETLDGADELRAGLADFLARFGHLGDNGNDLTVPAWKEAPEQVLRLVAAPPAPTNAPRLSFAALPLSRARRLLVGPLYRRAARFRLFREQVSSAYTRAVTLLRDHYLALGERLARRGLLAAPEDIFLLYEDEVRQAVDTKDDGADLRATIGARRAEIIAARDAVLPPRFVGEAPGPWVPPEATVLRGTPASRGRYTGRVRLARHLDALWGLAPGEVLVVPYSDVSWTPFFAKAGAVVAESGGLLSHSAIVAREYGLPAVVSVEGACCLRDGTLVNVDGYSGEVTVLEEAPDSEPVVRIGSEQVAE